MARTLRRKGKTLIFNIIAQGALSSVQAKDVCGSMLLGSLNLYFVGETLGKQNREHTHG